MARYVTRINSPKSADEAFAYMADLRNFAQWDPGVKKAVLTEGDTPGLGTCFDVTVKGPGRDLTLRYRITEFNAPHELLAVAKSSVFTSIDRITVIPTPSGCTVTYNAELRLNGLLAVADPGLRIAFHRIGDRATRGLRTALGPIGVD
jgi:hypothetical protein